MKSVSLLLGIIFLITIEPFATANFRRGPLLASKSSVTCPRSPIPVPLPKEMPTILRASFLLVDDLVNTVMEKTNTTSTSVGIVYNNEVIYAKPFSFASPNQKAPNTTLDTLYRLGSLSKVFTDIMLVKLRDQNKVHIDDEVQTYWPNFQVQTPNGRGITFLQLARQLSGLPAGSPCNYFPSCNITTDQAFELLSQIQVVHPTDYLPHYSDVAFAVLGRALEKPAGLTWEDFMTKEILSPLNMTSTGWEFTESVLPRFAPPLLNQPIAPALAFDDMDWARPTGGMYSSVNDLIKFLKLFLSANIAQTNPVVLGSSLREMLLPGYINNDQSTGFGFPFEWMYNKDGRTWTITKGGFFPGYTAFISFVPKLNFGVVVLSNNVLAVQMGADINSIILPALQQYLVANQPAAPNPGNLTLYAGTYLISYAPLGNANLIMDISVSPNNTLLFGETGSLQPPTELVWVQGNLFQMLPPFSYSGYCEDLEMSADYEYVIFQVQNGEVVSFQYADTDPFYGISWKKIS